MGDPPSSGVVHWMEIELNEVAVIIGAPGFAGTAAAIIAISEVRVPVPIALTAATLNLKVCPAGERPVLMNWNVFASTS